MNNLTTIAQLPQGGGCLAKLPAEVGLMLDEAIVHLRAINQTLESLIEPRTDYFTQQLEAGDDE